MTLVEIDICVKKWLDDWWIKTTTLSVDTDDFPFFLMNAKIIETWI